MFQPSLAVIFNLNAAVILQQIYWWMKNPFHRGEKLPTQIDAEGRVWVKIPPEVLDDKFPFISVATRNRTFEQCKKEGVLRTEKLDRIRSDQTNYYHVVLSEVVRIENEYEAQKENGGGSETGTDSPTDDERSSRSYQNDKVHSLTHVNEGHSIKMSECTADQSDDLYNRSDCIDVHSVKMPESNVRTTKRKNINKKQQQKENGAAAFEISNFKFGDLTIDRIIQTILGWDVGLSEETIRSLVTRSETAARNAAQQVVWWPDRPYSSAEWCAKQTRPVNRGGFVRAMLTNLPGMEGYIDEPAPARKRREAAEQAAAAREERLKEAAAKRRQEEEEEFILESKRQKAEEIFRIWAQLHEKAKSQIHRYVRECNEPLARLIEQRGGPDVLDKGSEVWVSYMEMVALKIRDVIEEFPLLNTAGGEAGRYFEDDEEVANIALPPADEDEDEVEFFDEMPDVDIREHKISLLASEIAAGRIDPDDIVRSELDAWTFDPEKWEEICQEARKRAQELS